MSARSLLDPAFLQRLEALRRRLVVRPTAHAGGDRSSRRRGASTEFADHRAYHPGDDLRRIDWAAFARSGEPVVKIFRAEEDAVVRVLLDTSGSMEGEKLDHGARLAAALGYLGLAAGERVQVLPFAESSDASHAAARGRSAAAPLFQRLLGLQSRGATDLAASVEPVLRARRAGLLAVLSDFLDPAGVEGPLRRVRAAGHDLVLVHVLAPDEIDPPWEGDVVLEDSETGALVEVTLDAAALRAYRARLEALQSELRELARNLGARYVLARTDGALEDTLLAALDARGARELA